jgi:hypothetical protein
MDLLSGHVNEVTEVMEAIVDPFLICPHIDDPFGEPSFIWGYMNEISRKRFETILDRFFDMAPYQRSFREAIETIFDPFFDMPEYQRSVRPSLRSYEGISTKRWRKPSNKSFGVS